MKDAVIQHKSIVDEGWFRKLHIRISACAQLALIPKNPF
jgi:hypothetical protein